MKTDRIRKESSRNKMIIDTTKRRNKGYEAVGSSRPILVFTEEEEKWLQDHPLKDQESELERVQRMLDALSLMNKKALDAYLEDKDVLSVDKNPYSNKYTLDLAADGCGELIDVSSGIVRNIDTWSTEQEKVDGANRRFAQSGLGCFPVLSICPICNETFMTSSSLPLCPDQHRVLDGKVVHTKCLEQPIEE